jgi:hypothetical protein
LKGRAEGAHGRFAGVVNFAVRPRGAVSDRADIDNRTALARYHAGQHGADSVEDAFEEDVDLVGHIGDIPPLERSDPEETGIVDEALGGTMDRLRFADRVFQGDIVGNVDRRLPDLLDGNAVKRFGVTGNEQKRMTLGRESNGDCPANAVTGASNHDKWLGHAIPFRTKSGRAARHAHCPMPL